MGEGEGEKEEEKNNKEEGRREEKNPGLDTCLEVWNLICVSLELWYGNYMCLELLV